MRRPTDDLESPPPDLRGAEGRPARRSRKRPTSKAEIPSDSGPPIPAQKRGKATRGSDRPCDGVQLVGGCVREAGHPGACRLGKPRPSGHDVYPEPAFLDAVGLGVAPRVAQGARWAVFQGDNRATLAASPREAHKPAGGAFDQAWRAMGGAKADAVTGIRLILTDPPFAAATHAGARSRNANAARPGVELGDRLVTFEPTSAAFIGSVLTAALPWTDDRGAWAVFTCDWLHAAELMQAPPEGWKAIRFGIWEKMGTSAPQFSGDRPGTGWEAVIHLHTDHGGRMRWNGGGHDSVYHHRVTPSALYPTAKPRSLGAQILERFTDPGDLVLDPWCGGGTWGRAAVDHRRRWIGIDQDSEAIRLTLRALSQETLPGV